MQKEQAVTVRPGTGTNHRKRESQVYNPNIIRKKDCTNWNILRSILGMMASHFLKGNPKLEDNTIAGIVE
jgi:hypothetical protein